MQRVLPALAALLSMSLVLANPLVNAEPESVTPDTGESLGAQPDQAEVAPSVADHFSQRNRPIRPRPTPTLRHTSTAPTATPMTALMSGAGVCGESLDSWHP